MKIPKIETLVILLFFGAVCLWAVSKCRAKQASMAARDRKYVDDDYPTKPLRDTLVLTQQPIPPSQSNRGVSPINTSGANPQQPTNSNTPLPRSPQNASATGEGAAPTNNVQTSSTPKYSTLYVVIDGLKMRKEPGLKGDVLTKLELYQPVSFLNQKTEWTQEISLGKEKVTDHWVKIRTATGKEGWVFGAGVHYYKMKRKGVLE